VEVKKFYRTQREVASTVNKIIDDYWADNLTDEETEDNIMIIFKKIKIKLLKQ